MLGAATSRFSLLNPEIGRLGCMLNPEGCEGLRWLALRSLAPPRPPPLKPEAACGSRLGLRTLALRWLEPPRPPKQAAAAGEVGSRRGLADVGNAGLRPPSAPLPCSSSRLMTMCCGAPRGLTRSEYIWSGSGDRGPRGEPVPTSIRKASLGDAPISLPYCCTLLLRFVAPLPFLPPRDCEKSSWLTNDWTGGVPKEWFCWVPKDWLAE
mmetsp:Transcript_38306/g.68418  ORF Transcript_38306/g.68418 Transcript_38306/m.68418 type:complete len:209 (+) Transcript_38306:348-974(+)